MEKLTTEWNLKDIYASEELAKQDFEKIKKQYCEFVNFKGKLKTKEGLLSYFNASDNFELLSNKLMAYLQLRQALDGKDKFSRDMQEAFSYFMIEEEPKLAFIEPELCKNKTTDLKNWKKLEEFKDYDLEIESILTNKKHALDEKTNRILSMIPSFNSNEEAYDKFESVDVKFGEVEVEGKNVVLTPALYGTLVQNENQNVRKAAYNTILKSFADMNYTLASLYISQTKENDFFVKIGKYKSKLDASCESIKVNPKIVETLIKTVHDNLNLFYEFEDKKKKALKLDEYFYFDNYANMGKASDKCSYEKGVSLMFEALEKYGEEYIDTVKKAVSENWIDVYEKPAKTTGGFSLGVFGLHPYILLNWGESYRDVSTLCHEMGHTMHSYFSNKNQPISKSNYSIFVAEVASTVNENLLNMYMLDHAKTKQEKLFYVHSFLSDFYATVYRQTMFTEFEHFVISSVENKIPLSAETLNEKYAELQHLYFGENAKPTEFSKFEWSRIPHFYSPYYVYKYATGFISASIIAKNIYDQKPGYLEKYLKFLSSGSSIYPIDLLKTVDVDLEKQETLSSAFETYKKYIEEFSELTKEK